MEKLREGEGTLLPSVASEKYLEGKGREGNVSLFPQMYDFCRLQIGVEPWEQKTCSEKNLVDLVTSFAAAQCVSPPAPLFAALISRHQLLVAPALRSPTAPWREDFRKTFQEENPNIKSMREV